MPVAPERPDVAATLPPCHRAIEMGPDSYIGNPGSGQAPSTGRLSSHDVAAVRVPLDPQALERLPFYSEPEPGQARCVALDGSAPDLHLGRSSPVGPPPESEIGD